MNRLALGITMCFLLVGNAIGKPKSAIEVEALVGTYYLGDPSAAQRWSKIIKIEKTENGIQIFENHYRRMERVGLVDGTTIFRETDVTVGPYSPKVENDCLIYKKEDSSVVSFSIIFEGGQLKGLMPRTEEKKLDSSSTILDLYLKQ